MRLLLAAIGAAGILAGALGTVTYFVCSTATNAPAQTPGQPLFTGWEWLGRQRAATLREQPDVVNLAVLDNGSVRYAARYSVAGAGWPVDEDAPGIDEAAIEPGDPTGVVFDAGGNSYTLNLDEPFTFDVATPAQVYLFTAGDGGYPLLHVLTVTATTRVPWERISRVRAELPGSIAANPDLSGVAVTMVDHSQGGGIA